MHDFYSTPTQRTGTKTSVVYQTGMWKAKTREEGSTQIRLYRVGFYSLSEKLDMLQFLGWLTEFSIDPA